MSSAGNLFNVETSNYVDSNILFVRASNPIVDPDGSSDFQEPRRMWQGIKWDDDAKIAILAKNRPREYDTIEGIFSTQKRLEEKKGDRVVMTKRLYDKPHLPPILVDVEYDYNLADLSRSFLVGGAVSITGGVALGAALWGTVLTGFYAGAVGVTGGVILVLPIGYGVWKLFHDSKRNIESSSWDAFPISFTPDLAPGQLGRQVTVVSSAQQNAAGSNTYAGKVPSLDFKFMNYPTDMQIANLASQTKITVGKSNNPFSKKSKDDVAIILNNFYIKTLNQLKRSTQFKMVDACSRALGDSGLISINKQISDAKKTLDLISENSPENTKDIKHLQDSIKNLKFSRYVIQDFLNNLLKPEVDKVFRANLPENLGSTPTSFGAFMEKFTTYFNAYYDALEKSPDAKKKAGTSALNTAQKKAKEAKKTSTIISSVEQVDFEKKAAQAAGEAQIIRVSGSRVLDGGFDTFISGEARQDSVFYSQTQTVLDVFKNDTQNTPLFSDQLAVETNSPENLTSSTDLSSACIKVLEAMSPTTRKALITALEGRKSLSMKNVFSALVNIKQLQSDPMFKLSGYFTGFGGLSFASFAKLPLGSSIDVKALKDVINIEGMRASLDAATRVLNSLDVGVIANGYFAQVSALTHAFSDPFVNAYNSMAATITSVDLKGALKDVSAQDLARCPSIAQLQSYVYNPNLKGTEGVKLLKTNATSVNLNMMQELNKISDQLDELDKIESQSKRIQDSLDSTSKLQAQSNIVGTAETARQKASSLNLGTSVTSVMPLANVNTPPKQVVINKV